MLTPERSMEIQRLLGCDIVMAFDECPRADRPRAEIEASMELSMRWAQRSRDAFDAGGEHAANSALFGIQQGALDEAPARAFGRGAARRSASTATRSAGSRWGKGRRRCSPRSTSRPASCPRTAPRYLMGVGKPDDLVGAVLRGVDMFDCVLPTRSGRNGQAFTWAGPVNLRNARHAEDPAPLDPRCACEVCTTYSRAYLHHLTKAGEMLGAMLLTEHNLSFYQQLMAGMRAAIGEGRMKAFAADFARGYGSERVEARSS